MIIAEFYLGCLFGLAILIPVYLYRAIVGPNVFDRLIGLNGITAKAILFLVLVGAFTNQLDMFVDIALGYGLLNLVGSLAVGKYLEKKGLKE